MDVLYVESIYVGICVTGGSILRLYLDPNMRGSVPRMPSKTKIHHIRRWNKAFSVFPVNSTSSAENGRRNILKTSTNISLIFLLYFWIPLSRLPRTSVLHFRTVPPGPFLRPKTKFQFWPPPLRSDSGTGRVGIPPNSPCSSLEVCTP